MINRIFENLWKLIKENKFQTINQISNDLICNICNKLTIKTCYSPCGCIYCSDCIENYLDGKSKFCPGKSKYCQQETINYEKDIVIDYPKNIRISEMKVKCPNKCCEFTDELSLIENHMKTCNKNSRVSYVNNRCSNGIMKCEMKDNFCTEIYCHEKLIDFISKLQMEMESIKNEMVTLVSENKYLKEKLEVIKVESINNYVKNENLSNKIVENLSSEIEELNVKLNEIKKENKSLRDKLEKFKKPQRKSEQQTTKIDEINEKHQKLNRQIDIQKSNKQIDIQNSNKQIDIQNSNKQIEIQNSKKQKIIDNDNNTIDLVKKSNNLLIKSVETKTIQEKNNFGKFEWKIEDFSLKEKIDIFSEPFYSHRNGYKMCLSVWLDGDFVQVWFYLMKGEFDNELMWPFKYGITVDIINQKNGTVSSSKTINCDDHPNDQRWNKPISERNYAIYFYSAKKSKEIIRNNLLIIKCKINF